MEVIIMNFKLFTKYSNIEMLLLTNLGIFFFFLLKRIPKCGTTAGTLYSKKNK